jgi:hypothetical protein
VQQQIHFFTVRFDNKVYDLLDLGYFGVVYVLSELKGLAPVLYFQLTSSHLIRAVKFKLEVIE